MSSRYREVARVRPVELLRPRTSVPCSTRSGELTPVPRRAPFVTVLGTFSHESPSTAPVSLVLASGNDSFAALWDPVSGALALGVTVGGATRTTHRSRRRGTVHQRPEAMALTLTGTHLTVLTLENGQWEARARHDLRTLVDVRDEEWLDGLAAGVGVGGQVLREVRAGTFGQLGLRDVRAVTLPDGTPLVRAGQVLLSATCAGPGFFDTAHTGLFALDPTTHRLTHLSDLWFRRPDAPGVFGDHAVHVVHDPDSTTTPWSVAASTWSDFHVEDNPQVRCTLSRSAENLERGEHVLESAELPLPTDGFSSVGLWDPHLIRDGDLWRVAYVSARKWFSFHPVTASGPTLDALTLDAALTSRRATEGTTWVRTDDGLRLFASDGRDNPRGYRERYPVLDASLRETGTLDAPYLSNIPWPTLVDVDGRRLMITFDGTVRGGDLLGYGTHGDLVVLSNDD